MTLLNLSVWIVGVFALGVWLGDRTGRYESWTTIAVLCCAVANAAGAVAVCALLWGGW